MELYYFTAFAKETSRIERYIAQPWALIAHAHAAVPTAPFAWGSVERQGKILLQRQQKEKSAWPLGPVTRPLGKLLCGTHGLRIGVSKVKRLTNSD